MHNPLKIKVCGMRDPGNILDLVECMPDFMGFIFYPGSKRFVRDPDPELFRSIPPGIRKVGVYVNESTDTIKRMVAELCLDLVQLHGDEPPDACDDLSGCGIPVMKAFRISASIDHGLLKDYDGSCDYFLLDKGGSGFGGTGKKFDWNLLANSRLSKPYFLSGGIDPGDVPSILSFDRPAMTGVDINSRFETEPGVKDVGKVCEFIKSIRRINK